MYCQYKHNPNNTVHSTALYSVFRLYFAIISTIYSNDTYTRIPSWMSLFTVNALMYTAYGIILTVSDKLITDKGLKFVTTEI